MGQLGLVEMGDTLQPGYYKVANSYTWFKVLLVEEGTGLAKGSVFGDHDVAFEYGDFGEADPGISAIAGVNRFNVQVSITVDNEVDKTPGLVTDKGETLFMKRRSVIRKLIKISEEEANEILEDGD